MDIFTILDLSTTNLINKYLIDFPPIISEHTFTNLFAWSESRPVWICEINGGLIFLIKTDLCRNDEMVIFGPPLGNLPLSEVFKKLGNNIIGGIRLTKNEIDSLENESLIINPDRDNSDYVYMTNNLADLASRKYAKKRSHIRHCLDNYNCVYEHISENNINECRELLQRWCQIRECDLDPGLCGESQALHMTLNHFTDFSLFGGAIRIDDQIQAFSIGERLNQNTAVCHFEKAMPEINGLNQLINHWFAQNCLSEFEFVNREQDLGIPGLRQAKESYHPNHLLEKFTVFRTSP